MAFLAGFYELTVYFFNNDFIKWRGIANQGADIFVI